MSTGVFAATDAISNTTVTSGATSEAGAFVPEMWSNEVIANYKSNLVVAQLVTQMNHVGKKGDTVNIPTISSRRAANARRPSSAGDEGLLDGTLLKVSPGQVNPSLTSVTIDRHFEYSTLIEDFAAVQALGSLRRFYTDDAGYSLARRVDWDLHLLGRNASPATADPGPGGTVDGADYEQAASGTVNANVIGSDGSTAWAEATNGNAASLADAGIRRMIRTLDDNDVPLSGRAFIIPPIEKENLLGIARFTEQAFTGEASSANSIRNGLIGDLYDNPVYVSSNCPTVNTVGATVTARACTYLHKDAFVLIMQMNMRSQAAYMQQYLSTLLTSDTIYGVEQLRGLNRVTFLVPAS
jgi:hypothetical protein